MLNGHNSAMKSSANSSLWRGHSMPQSFHVSENISCSEFRSLSGRCFAARQFLPLTVPAASHSFQSVPTAPPRPCAGDGGWWSNGCFCWRSWGPDHVGQGETGKRTLSPNCWELLRFQHVSTKNMLVRWLKSNHKESKPMQKSKQWGESFSMPGLQHITIWLFNIAMENPPFLIGKPSINGPFSIAMLVITRG